MLLLIFIFSLNVNCILITVLGFIVIDDDLINFKLNGNVCRFMYKNKYMATALGIALNLFIRTIIRSCGVSAMHAVKQIQVSSFS